MKKTKPKKIAIVTYNRIGNGQYENGVIKTKDKEIYIAQNGHKAKWAASGGNDREKEKTRSMVAATTVRQIDLKNMDHVYLYVGANGGEEAIRQTRNMPADKITYVMCGCNYGMKERMVRDLGNDGAEIVRCECGGRDTLEKIVKRI